MTTKPINFFTPGTDAAVDMDQIQRQRDMAALMMRSSFKPQETQGQMVSGHYIPPSALSAVMPALNMLASNKINERADASQRKLAEALRARNTQEANDFMGAMSGAPGRTIQPLTPNDDEGNAMPVAQAAAVPPDRNRAMALALQAQNPQIQAMGGELMKQQMAEATRRERLAAAGFPADGGGSSGAPSGQGGMYGMDPRAVALQLSGDPELAKLGQNMLEAQKPQAQREGVIYARNPDGSMRVLLDTPKVDPNMQLQRGPSGQVTGVAPIPGATNAVAQLAGAEAGAQAAARDPYQPLVTVPTAGGPRMMTPAQARQEAGGGQAAAPGMTGRAGPTNAAERGMASQVADTLQGSQAQLVEGLKRDLATPGAITNPQDRRNAEQYLAQLQGAGAGRGGQGGAPVGAQPTGPGIALQSAEQKAYGETRAKGFAEQASGVQKGAQTGASMLRNLDELRTLYSDPNVAKGALAESFSGLKNVGASFGIDMKGLSSEQAAQAITNKMALDARSTADGGGMPGAMSDADRNFLKNLQPDLSKSPEGRVKIMDAMQKTAQRQIDVARLATEYEQRNGRLDAGFDKVVREYAAKNQMFTQAKPGGGFKILGVK